MGEPEGTFRGPMDSPSSSAGQHANGTAWTTADGMPAVMSGIAPGSQVRLRTPENARLHMTLAVVELLLPWGAHVYAEAAATRRFRALWSEMVLVSNNPLPSDDSGDGREWPPPEWAQAYVANSSSSSPYAASRGEEPTGSPCGNCGSMNVFMRGRCATCQDCGETGGCS